MGVFDTIGNALSGHPGATPAPQHKTSGAPGTGVSLQDQTFARLRAGRDAEVQRLQALKAKPAAAPSGQTKLTPEQELFFQHWVARSGQAPPPGYDIRGFWLAQRAGDPRAQITRDANGNAQYPADWKAPEAEIGQ